MESALSPEIKYNHKLINFCNRIVRLNFLLNSDDIRYMFFGSLISSDALIDVHACDETIETASFIKENIDLFVLDERVKEETLSYMDKSLEIAKRDREGLLEGVIA